MLNQNLVVICNACAKFCAGNKMMEWERLSVNALYKIGNDNKFCTGDEITELEK